MLTDLPCRRISRIDANLSLKFNEVQWLNSCLLLCTTSTQINSNRMFSSESCFRASLYFPRPLSRWLHKTIKADSYLRMGDKRRSKQAGAKTQPRIARWVIRAVLSRANASDDTQSFIVLIPKKCSCCGIAICLYKAIRTWLSHLKIRQKNCLSVIRSKRPWLVNGGCQGLLADYGGSQWWIVEDGTTRRPH